MCYIPFLFQNVTKPQLFFIVCANNNAAIQFLIKPYLLLMKCTQLLKKSNGAERNNEFIIHLNCSFNHFFFFFAGISWRNGNLINATFILINFQSGFSDYATQATTIFGQVFAQCLPHSGNVLLVNILLFGIHHHLLLYTTLCSRWTILGHLQESHDGSLRRWPLLSRASQHAVKATGIIIAA